MRNYSTATSSRSAAHEIAHVAEKIDASSWSAIRDFTPEFEHFARNWDLFAFLSDEIKRGIESNAAQPFYSPQSFAIAASPSRRVFVRGNVWPPLSDDATIAIGERDLYSIGLPHDHNFHLLTFGAFGPGYATDVYEIEESPTQRMIGDKVEYTSREQWHLPEGKTLAFRAHRHVHTQQPPSAFSVSINLIFCPPDLTRKDQCWFKDEGRHLVVTGYPASNAVSRQSTLLRLAMTYGDEGTKARVRAVASDPRFPDRARAQFR